MKNTFMKLITLTAFAAFSTLAFADIEQSNRSCSWDNAGSLQSGSCDKAFVKVKNAEASATIESGSPVILDYSDDNGANVISSSTAFDVPYCVMAESCAAAETGCDCQVWGVMTDFRFDDRVDEGSSAVATAGKEVYLSEGNAGYGQVIGDALDFRDRPIGIVLDTTSSSADMEVFIRLK